MLGLLLGSDCAESSRECTKFHSGWHGLFCASFHGSERFWNLESDFPGFVIIMQRLY